MTQDSALPALICLIFFAIILFVGGVFVYFDSTNATPNRWFNAFTIAAGCIGTTVSAVYYSIAINADTKGA